MAVKILIKRVVSNDKGKELTPLLIDLRNRARKRPGYISGETLSRVDRPGENLTIGIWHSYDDLKNWMADAERSEVQQKIDRLLGRETEYEIYE